MRTILFSVLLQILLISNICALEEPPPDIHPQGSAIDTPRHDPSLPAPMTVSSPAREETIILTAPLTEPEIKQLGMAYFIKPGASFAIHDKTFRGFLDYGPAISVGIDKEMNENLSIIFSVGLEALKGKWSIAGTRESIFLAGEEYIPGYVPGPGETITAEDLPNENLGMGVIANAEGVVISDESLRRVDAKTTLYLMPITLSAKYWLHKDKKVNPYVGGGLGFCFARRDVESSAVKEKFFLGPEYLIQMQETQYVTGLVLNLLAGIEIPLKNKMRFVAQARTGLYDLKRFDPIFEVSYLKPTPGWYSGSFLSSFTGEEPVKIGVFNYEIVSSATIGLVVPF